MKSLKYIIALIALVSLASCYEDFTHDYENPDMGFAVAKPLRTVIADRDMSIYIGVAIGGKREVDMSDWAKFVIDESLLEGTGKILLPESYYKLGSKDKFTVRKSNLPVADVKIDFTDEFYSDPLSLTGVYALPFRMTENSLNALRKDATTTIAAIKYISTYAGTYYRFGSVTKGETKTSFGSSVDLVNCDAFTMTTLGKNIICCEKLGTVSGSYLNLEFNGKDITLTIDGDATFISGSGTYTKEGKYDFVAEHGVKAPQIDLSYKFSYEEQIYEVTETLVLRQDPLKDLRVETW